MGLWFRLYGLNSLKGGYRGDYFGEWFRAHPGDTWSLDYSLYGWFPKIKGTFERGYRGRIRFYRDIFYGLGTYKYYTIHGRLDGKEQETGVSTGVIYSCGWPQEFAFGANGANLAVFAPVPPTSYSEAARTDSQRTLRKSAFYNGL